MSHLILRTELAGNALAANIVTNKSLYNNLSKSHSIKTSSKSFQPKSVIKRFSLYNVAELTLHFIIWRESHHISSKWHYNDKCKQTISICVSNKAAFRSPVFARYMLHFNYLSLNSNYFFLNGKRNVWRHCHDNLLFSWLINGVMKFGSFYDRLLRKWRHTSTRWNYKRGRFWM